VRRDCERLNEKALRAKKVEDKLTRTKEREGRERD